MMWTKLWLVSVENSYERSRKKRARFLLFQLEKIGRNSRFGHNNSCHFALNMLSSRISTLCKTSASGVWARRSSAQAQSNVANGTTNQKMRLNLVSRNIAQRWASSGSNILDTITTIDCNYMERQDYAYSYLIRNGKHSAFIDNNTNHCIPKLMQTLSDQGLTPEDVQYIIITHVHLDHAGATGQLAELCPNAQVLAHPVRNHSLLLYTWLTMIDYWLFYPSLTYREL